MINITIVTHSGLFVIHIASFVLKIPYLIPAICHQQLMRGWLIIQPSHAWLQPVPVNCRGGRKKASVSGWSVLTIPPPRLRVNNADPRHHPRPSGIAPRVSRAYIESSEMRWWPRTLPASGLRHPALSFPMRHPSPAWWERRGRVTRPRVCSSA